MIRLRRWSVKHARALEAMWRAFERVLPSLRPFVQWAGAARVARLMTPLERAAKGLLFDCRMCGRCALSASGMACPMNCPKRHRNGPCGGVRDDGGCEVDPQLRCVWLEGLEGAARMREGGGVRQPQPPVDYSLEGSSSWLRAIVGAPAAAPKPPLEEAGAEAGALERACRSGRFVVTAEITPPDSARAEDLIARAAPLRGLVDAINLTDSAGAHAHMSSLAACAILSREGHHTVFQIACRDRNRIAMQADILGAAALGLRNLLCITGDHVASGDHPGARPVFDLDSVSLLEIARDMRRQGTYASGRALAARPALFLGAAANPFAPPFEDRVDNLERKLAAGAQFIETQYCLDVRRLESFLERVRSRGLEGRFALLVGVGPIVSAKLARWMQAHVPGVYVPPEIIRRLEAASDPLRESVRICVEIIRELRSLRGVSGVHLMAHRRERLIVEILEEAGLTPRPAALAAAH